MENPSSAVEKLLQDKVLLFQDLLSVLEQERQTLLSSDVESLWQISELKNALTRRIEEARGQILEALETAGIQHKMAISSFKLSQVLQLLPGGEAKQLRNLELTLVKLKGETKARVEENKRFVGEYLRILDELIGIISDCGKGQGSYGNPRVKANPRQANLLLHKEV